MDFEKLCNEIFDLDQRIRYVAVYDSEKGRVAGGMRKGLQSHLPEYVTNLSVDGSFVRWESRMNMQEWIGEPLYAFAEYKKVKRFTFYITAKKLLVISTKKDIDNKIADSVLSIL